MVTQVIYKAIAASTGGMIIERPVATTVDVGEPIDLFDEQAEELTELAWQERALCAQTDPEAFFPEKGGSTREAKKVCLGCDVRGDCLEYALAHDERFGIWGGLSERERRRLKKEAV
jgi:WhiB family redox-sensing transcriptional regulator